MPITSQRFLNDLSKWGFTSFTGVPCSYFTGPVAIASNPNSDQSYTPAANEGAAFGMAVGNALAGRRTALFIQNSGFGNLVNPLTSLCLPYEIPVLVFMSMRGWPEAAKGEPQHYWTGKTSHQWLDSLHIPYANLTAESSDLTGALESASVAFEHRKPFFVLVGKGAVEDVQGSLDAWAVAQDPKIAISRDELISTVMSEVTEEVVLSTTGHMSRALFAHGDRPSNFYMQGSMGHLASIAAGLSVQPSDRKIYVLDGDGAVLMHAGALVASSSAPGNNIIHLVFANGTYASTGGQTVPGQVDFALLGQAMGYSRAVTVNSVNALAAELRIASTHPSSVLISVIGSAVTSETGERASEAISPRDMTTRLMEAQGRLLR